MIPRVGFEFPILQRVRVNKIGERGMKEPNNSRDGICKEAEICRSGLPALHLHLRTRVTQLATGRLVKPTACRPNLIRQAEDIVETDKQSGG